MLAPIPLAIIYLGYRFPMFLLQNQHRGGNMAVAYAEYVDVMVYNYTTRVRLGLNRQAYVSYTTVCCDVIVSYPLIYYMVNYDFCV